jgi:hypothetical protein
VSTRQYAKRQQTWFRHQLGGAALTLDATRNPERVAQEIVDAWNREAGTDATMPRSSRTSPRCADPS